MRILITTRHLGVVGGVEAYLRELLGLLAGSGHELAVGFEVAAPDGESILGPDTTTPACLLPADSPGPLVDLIERWQPDVAVNQGLESGALEAVLADRVPTLLHAHAYDSVCVSGTRRHAWPARRDCTRPFGVGCLALYHPRGCGGRNPMTTLRLFRAVQTRAAALPRYRRVMVASSHMRDVFRLNGLADDQIELVPLFPPGARPLAQPPQPRAPTRRVLFAGRIVEDKGWQDLAVALPAASRQLGTPLTLCVAGDGPDREAMVADLGSAGVATEVPGWLDRDRLRAEMARADLLLVPSVWPEPFGLVGLEAACLGVPAVAYGHGGITDWLQPGLTGEVAPGERPDPTELASAMVRALGDDQHWQRLREGAWEMAGRFSPERHLAQLQQLLRQVAGKQV